MRRHSYGSVKVPKKMRLKDGTVVIVRAMHDHEMADAFSLIQLQEVFDKGFGVETYPDVTVFCRQMATANKFTVESRASQLPMAFILVYKSRFSRGVINADALIVVRPEHLSPEFLEVCLTLALASARETGFQGLYVDTFDTNADALRVIKDNPGFLEVARLPGCTRDRSDVTSVIFYNKFNLRSKKLHCCIGL